MNDKGEQDEARARANRRKLLLIMLTPLLVVASLLLGLFSVSHMAFEHDRGADPAGEPSLTAMTVMALEILSRNRKGFVLMVEGGRIDHAHHAGNAYRALVDTVEFARAVEAALARVDRRETLVLVTSDHGHVLTMSGYPVRGNPILGKVISRDEDGRPETTFSRDATGRPSLRGLTVCENNREAFERLYSEAIALAATVGCGYTARLGAMRISEEIDALVGQLDLTSEEEDFAREQAGRVFVLLANAYIDAHPRVQRARATTAAAVIAFATLKVWAEHDEAGGGGGRAAGRGPAPRGRSREGLPGVGAGLEAGGVGGPAARGGFPAPEAPASERGAGRRDAQVAAAEYGRRQPARPWFRARELV